MYRSDLSTLPFASASLANSFDTQDGLYDVAWSELHENQLVSASGDGSIKLWDIMLNVSVRHDRKESAREQNRSWRQKI